MTVIKCVPMSKEFANMASYSSIRFHVSVTRFSIAATLLACGGALTAPAEAGLFGPGKFEIVQTDDRFSTSPTITVMGRNNRISKKSPVGGVYIGDQGLYLEPLVIKNRANGQIVNVGFFFHNETELDTTYGSPNSIGTPQRVVIIVDGSRQIVAPIVQGGTRFGEGVQYNSIGRYASSSLTETGLAYVQIDDMAAIAHAQSIAIKVEGSTRAAIYDEKDIARTFLPNVAAFHANQIAK
jgi:hypothetical protein